MKFESVGKRVTLIIVIVLIFLGFTIFFNIVSLINSNQGLEQYKKLSDQTNNLSELERYFFNASLTLKDYIISYEELYKEAFIGNITNIKTFFENSQKFIITNNLQEFIENYEILFQQIVDLNNKKEILVNEHFYIISNDLKDYFTEFKVKAEESGSSWLNFYCDNSTQLIDSIAELASIFFSSKSAGDKNSVLEAFKELDSQVFVIQYGLETDELRKTFTEIQNYIAEFNNTFNQIVEAIESQDPIIQEMEQLRVEILNLLEEQRAQLKEQQDTLGPQLIEKNNNSILLTIILTVIAFVVAIIMVIYLIRSITKPLLELRNKINQLKKET